MAISDDILTNASGPKIVKNDRESAEQHSLPDQIAAARFLAAQNAISRNPLGMRLVKLRPPSASDVTIGSRGECL